MSGATAEALAWLERAEREEARGVRVGVREICRSCLRPLLFVWPPVLPCNCGETSSLDRWEAHGLGGLSRRWQTALQTGTTTYG